MAGRFQWFRRRPATFALVVFLCCWYAGQLLVVDVAGFQTAVWLFYAEPPLDAVTPGILLAPLSHNVVALSHLAFNLTLLLVAGCLVEPFVGRRPVVVTVVGLGYLGTYLANLTVGVHGYWILAGASGGVAALWAYGAVRTRSLAIRPLSTGVDSWRTLVESGVAILLLASLPLLLVHQSILVSQPHSGHVIGLLLGVAYAGFHESGWSAGV